MKERVLTFLGGTLVGIVLGIFVVSKPFIALAGAYPWFLALGTSILAFFGGTLIARKTTKVQPIRFSGRIFEFPQAPIMVEVALRRMESVIPARVTRNE